MKKNNRLVLKPGLNNQLKVLLGTAIGIGAIIFAAVFGVMETTSVDGGYADSGSGTYHGNIFWFTWENGDLSDGVHDGDTKTFTVPGGLEITTTFSNVTGQASDNIPTDMATWSGAVAHRYYQISGSNGEALYGGNGDDGDFRITFTATLEGAPYTPHLIFIDPESTDGGENLKVTTNGDDWEVIETLPEGGINLDLSNPKQLQIFDGSAKVPILLSRSATQLDVSINAGGRQGVAFGLWFSMDYGDAPDSYGTQDVSSGAKHLQDPSVPLFLGSQVDAETDGSASGTGSEDNTGGNNDEDGVTLPASMEVLSAFTLDKSDINLTNQSGGQATLHAWIDFNANGTFETKEYTSTTVANNTLNGNPDGDLVWSNIQDGVSGSSYARFRLTTDGNINSAAPGGLAMDGEVEDYPVTLSYTFLPVEWLSLDAKWQGSDVLVSWQTAKEVNTDYFQVERQVGTQGMFQPIGETEAAGFAEEVQTYRLVDQEMAQISNPAEVIYRIKQVDIDGKFEYSNLIELQGKRGKPALSFTFGPNPASEQLNVQLIIPDGTATSFTVRSLDGKTTFERSFTHPETLSVNVSSWPRGIYILTLGNEEEQTSKRLVVR
ncbi:MAG: CshA/CshB family fibrillar adhesin-related protein [Bacteroidota bacterium]